MLSTTPLPLHDLTTYEGLPAMTVQISLFSGGGYAIGVKISHMLADAQSLLVFVNLWATKSQAAMFGTTNIKSHVGVPVFDPSALDARAAGNIDSPAADPGIVAAARALPLHRYDWWDTAAPGYSPYLAPTAEASKPPPSEQLGTAIRPETRAPWYTWDLSRPVSHALLHFSRAELENLKKAALEEEGTNGSSNHTVPGISRLDALLAHIFRTVNRARFGGDAATRSHGEKGEEEEEEMEVFLDVTLDVRRRVSPPLPGTFIGSPLFLTHVKATTTTTSAEGQSGDGVSKSLGTVARELRSTMRLFTPDKVAAMLHDAAFEPSPQRLWQGFVGERHVLVTSWLRLPLYEIDFVGGGGAGGKQRPRYVHPVMPSCDGVVLVVDSALAGYDSGCGGCGGVDVGLFLDREVMGRFLGEGEGELRKFR